MTRKSLEIAETLERAILCGEFPQGSLMNEPELAARFGVSRTPVREALLNLSASGLVELKRGSGAIVNGISLDTIFEGYEVLADSLGFACALAAERMTPRQRASLQTIVAEMKKHVSEKARDRYIALDEQLLEEILEGANNSMLARQVRDCKRRIATVRHLSMRSHRTVEHLVPEIERFVSAISARNPEDARLALQAFIALRGDGAQRLIAHWRELNRHAA